MLSTRTAGEQTTTYAMVMTTKLAITKQQIPTARETGRLMVIRWRSAKPND